VIATDAPPTSGAAPSRAATFFYRACLVGALATAAVAGAFFVIGVADGSVSSFNLGIWLVLLGGLGVALWAGWTLRARGRTGAAIAVLAIVAAPGLVYALFALLLVVLHPRWN